MWSLSRTAAAIYQQNLFGPASAESSEFDPFINFHIEKYGNKGGGRDSHMSIHSQTGLSLAEARIKRVQDLGLDLSNYVGKVIIM